MKKLIRLTIKIAKLSLSLWLISLSPVIIFALVMGFYEITSPSPPQPSITYGEFPFLLEYEVNGERFIIDDVYKIKYQGIGLTGAGKTLNWKGRFKSTRNQYISLYKTESDKEIVLFAPIRLLEGEDLVKTSPDIAILDEYSNNAKNWTILNDENLVEKFGRDFNFKVIKYEEAPSVNNEFVDKNRQDLIALIVRVIVFIILLIWTAKIWNKKKEPWLKNHGDSTNDTF